MTQRGSTFAWPPSTTRRAVVLGASACAGMLLAPITQSWSDTPRGRTEPFRIALPDLVGATPDDAAMAREVAAITVGDLKGSGRFAPIALAAPLATIRDSNALPSFDDWRAIKAEVLVVGRVQHVNDGRLKVEFRLWEVEAGRQLIGQQYFTTPASWRRVAHIIADVIYERLTGEKSNFEATPD